MKNTLKKAFCMLLVVVMLVGMLPAVYASAATVNYVTGNAGVYANVIKNWGIRGELATFLSPNAESFYQENGVSYAALAAKAGSADESAVPGSQLYQSLYLLMSSAHDTVTDYDEIVDAFCYTDSQNNGETSTMISGFYSGTPLISQWDKGLTWNREHTWPQSKSTGGSDIEDIMSIRPESSSVNSSRGNKAYGVSSGYYDPNTVSGGSYDVRGDAARIVLYTYVRWGGELTALQNSMWGSTGVMESVDVLLDWMAEDPVDTWEMGRNDSVESITGTRNVFVDYPELAFALFEADMPEMPTPSGNASSVSYTVTASSNHASYGSVSVNHQYVTAHPNPGYRTAGYEIVSGSASVTQNGDVFTVSGNCSIRILFEAKPQYTASFLQDGVQVSSVPVYEGDCVVMPGFSGNLPTGYSFIGWVTSVVQNETVKPSNVYLAGGECTVTENTTFYALLSWIDSSVSGQTYKLVTSASQLAADKSVVITAAESDRALSTTQNTNNRGAVNVTKGAENTLIFTEGEGVQVLTLVGGTVSGSFGLSTGSGYLYAASSGSNYLKTTDELNDNGSFAITVNSDGTCTLLAQGTNARNNLLYNSQSNIFSCYSGTSSNVKTVAMYVAEQGAGVVTYTMAWTYDPQEPTEPEVTVCGHANVTSVAGYAATLSSDGLTDGKICADCDEVLLEQQVIPCLASVNSWGLVLADDLTVNFKLYVAPSISATAKIHVSVADTAAAYAVSDLTAAGDDMYYVAVKVAAAQMGDTISVRIANGTDSSVTKEYSVLQYATAVLADAGQSQYHSLLKEMLNYGAAAQTYFNYHANDLVNTQIQGAGATAVPTGTSQEMTFTGSVEGIQYYGASLVYREKLAVRFYFEGDVEGISFSCNDAPCTPVAQKGMHYVEVGGILPQNIDQSITVTATDGAGNTFTATYSPMNYIVRMHSKGDAVQMNLMTALYNYHLAAKAVAQTQS